MTTLAVPGTADLWTPLAEVTFVVVDVETTGTRPGGDRIIEVGAARFRGGVCLETFQTVVNPGCAIPPFIVTLTGITEVMVRPAPPIGQVLPALVDFLGDGVLVGHNLRFDTSFLDAALAASGRAPLPHRRVDTLLLARRFCAGEVANLRLATLAARFRAPVPPTHRALDDVLATAEVLHALLERAGRFGVTGLDDLLALPTGGPALAKLPLLADLPRRPGVYLLRDAGGRVLYVGTAENLRGAVRAHLTAGRPGPLPPLMRDTAAVDHIACASAHDAAVAGARLIRAHRPRYNRRRGTLTTGRRRRSRRPGTCPWR